MHFPYNCSFSNTVQKNAMHLAGPGSSAGFHSFFHKCDCKALLTLHLNENYEQSSQWYTKGAKLFKSVVVGSDGNDTYMSNFSSNCNIKSKEAEVKK